jgi:hypothetical protein
MELAFGLGAAVLAAGIIYGMYSYQTRNRANDKIANAATREMYRDPEAYAHGGREKWKRELK